MQLVPGPHLEKLGSRDRHLLLGSMPVIPVDATRREWAKLSLGTRTIFLGSFWEESRLPSLWRRGNLQGAGRGDSVVPAGSKQRRIKAVRPTPSLASVREDSCVADGPRPAHERPALLLTLSMILDRTLSSI